MHIHKRECWAAFIVLVGAFLSPAHGFVGDISLGKHPFFRNEYRTVLKISPTKTLKKTPQSPLKSPARFEQAQCRGG